MFHTLIEFLGLVSYTLLIATLAIILVSSAYNKISFFKRMSNKQKGRTEFFRHLDYLRDACKQSNPSDTTLREMMDKCAVQYIMPSSDIIALVLREMQRIYPAFEYEQVQQTFQGSPYVVLTYPAGKCGTWNHTEAQQYIDDLLVSNDRFIKLANNLGIDIHGMRDIQPKLTRED